MKKYFIIILSTVLMTGCGTLSSWFSKDGNKKGSEAPAKLEPFRSTLAVTKLWSKDIGTGSRDRYAMLVPVVREGQVYVADSAGRVSAYDAQSGSRSWRVELKQTVTGATGFGADLVLVGTLKGNVIAMDKSTGKVRWSSEVSSEILAAPAAQAGVVIVRTVDGKVFGLATAGGQRRWIYERGVPSLTLRGTGAPLIHRNMVLTGFAGGKIVANDLQTGHVLWEATVAQPSGSNEIERLVDVDSRPVVADGVLYTAAYQGKVTAIALDTGRLLWARDLSSYSDLSVDSKYVYLSDEKSRVVALDRRTGTTVWRQEKLVGRVLTGPTNVGDYVAVGDLEGYLHFLAKEDGRFVARTRIAGKGEMTQPVSDRSNLYIVKKNGSLTALTIAPLR